VSQSLGQPPAVSRTRAALRFVLLLGVVSLFADLTYEGARSITGPYLASLGASAAVVGVVAGFGELVGYGLRLVSGRLSDRTGKYWPIAWFGYAVQMGSVPLLALAGRWEVASALVIAERTGKAIRNPPRDVLLAQATTEIGHGWGFGVHEALDQLGALAGPLLVAALLQAGGQYQTAFAALLVPAVLTLLLLGLTRALYPHPERLAASAAVPAAQGLPGRFWLYLAAVALVAAGFADFALLGYHFELARLGPASWVPLFYALAMAAGALGALVGGRLFDRLGVVVLVPLTVAAALFAPLVFLGGLWLVLVGVVLWGLGTGVHESLMPAVVAGLVPPARRGSAYGLFNAVYGVAWFLGSAAMGVLYERSLAGVVAFSVALESAAVIGLLLLARASPPRHSPRAAGARPTGM
jgi:predicted MFS family arabinose efflux permease